MTTIAKGVVKIDGQDNTQKAFKSVKKNADRMSVALKAAAVGLAAIAAVRGISRQVKATLDYADAIGKVATNSGMSTEYVQLYAKAMGEAGLTEEQANKSLVTFNKRLAELKLGFGAMLGPLGKYSEELVNQLEAAESSEEAMNIFINALESIEDPATQAALAAAAFDTEVGKKMPAALANGRGSLEGLMEAYRKTGKILTEEQVRMAEAANDSMAKVSDAWTSAKHSIIVEAAGPIIKTMEWMLDTAVPLMKDFFSAIGYGYDTYAKPGIDAMIELLGDLWTTILKPSFDMLVTGVQGAFKLVGIAWEEYVKPGFEAFKEFVDSTWKVIGPIFTAGAEIIGNALSSTFEFFSTAIEHVNSWMQGTQTGIETVKGIWDGFKVHMTGVISAFGAIFNGLAKPAQDAWDKVKEIWNDSIGWIVGKVEYLAGLLPDWMNPFAESAEKSSTSAALSVGVAEGGINSDLKSIEGQAESTSGSFVDSFSSIAKESAKAATEFAANAASKLSSSLSSLVTTGMNKAREFFNGVVGYFTNTNVAVVAEMDKMEEGVTEAGERINKKAFRNTWAKDFLKYVPGYYEQTADEVIGHAKRMEKEQTASGKRITDNAAKQAEERKKINQDMVENTSYTYKSMVDLSEGFVDDVGGIFNDVFTDLFSGDIKGAWETLLEGMKDMAIKTAADIAAAWTKDMLFGGGGNAGSGILDKIMGGMGGGGGGGGMGGASGILGKIGSLFKGGTSSGVVAGGSTSSGIVGGGSAGAGAGAGMSMSTMAGFAAPMAIFAFGMAKSMKDAKKNKAEYDAILADTVMKEKMATEEIANGYNVIGEKGGQTYAQLNEDMAIHMEKIYGNVDAINGNTDAYGNMIVKIDEFDKFMNDVQWQEITVGHMDAVKELDAAYGEMGVSGNEATRMIDMAMNNVINQEKEAKIYAEIMEEGFVSAANAMELSLGHAAGKTSEEFMNMVNATNAAQNGVARLSGDGINKLAALDASSSKVAGMLEDNMVSASESSMLGFRGLSEMSSEMFLSMIEYAKQASDSMDDLARSANNAGQAANSARQGGIPGYMAGGSFMVGGKGGLDSNIVAFKASNNERVTVETPQQQAVSDRGGKSSVNMTADLIEFVTKPIIKEMRKQSIIQASNERH